MLRTCLYYYSGHREWRNCPMVNGQPVEELETQGIAGWDDEWSPIFTVWRFRFATMRTLKGHKFAVYRQIG